MILGFFKKKKTNSPYASFHSRMVALMIDLFIVSFLTGPILALLRHWILPSSAGGIPMEELKSQGFVETMAANPEFHHMVYAQMALQALQIGMIIAATMLCWVYWGGQTPGKKICRLRIVDATTQQTPSRRQYVIRLLGAILSFVPLCLGFLVIIWHPKHQAWHDRWAHTLVMREQSLPIEQRM